MKLTIPNIENYIATKLNFIIKIYCLIYLPFMLYRRALIKCMNVYFSVQERLTFFPE